MLKVAHPDASRVACHFISFPLLQDLPDKCLAAMVILDSWQKMMAAVAVLEEAFAAGSSTAVAGQVAGTAHADAAAERGAGSANPEQTLSKKRSSTWPESGTATELDSCPSIPEEAREQFAEMLRQVTELEATVIQTKKFVGAYRLFNMCRKLQAQEKTTAQRAGAAVRSVLLSTCCFHAASCITNQRQEESLPQAKNRESRVMCRVVCFNRHCASCCQAATLRTFLQDMKKQNISLPAAWVEFVKEQLELKGSSKGPFKGRSHALDA